MKSRKSLTAASVGARCQNKLVRHQARDRQEILEGIDRHPGVEVRIDREQRAWPQQQRIAVGRRARGELARQVAVRAGPVLHHDRLTKARGQRLPHHAGDEVGGAARRIRHQQPDRPRRIGLRACGARERRDRGRKDQRNEGQPNERQPDEPCHGDVTSRGPAARPSCRTRAHRGNQSRRFQALSLLRPPSHNDADPESRTSDRDEQRTRERPGQTAYANEPGKRSMRAAGCGQRAMLEEDMPDKIYDVPPEWKQARLHR